MNNHDKAQMLMTYVGKNYQPVKANLKQALWSKNIKFCEDFFADILIICHDTIARCGFKFPKDMTLSGKSFDNYLFISYKNRKFNQHSERAKFMETIITLSAIEPPIESEHHAYEEARIARDEEELIQEIFEFVESKYEGERADIYKFYFYADLSMEEVAKISGISLGKISYTVKLINDDVLELFQKKRNSIK